MLKTPYCGNRAKPREASAMTKNETESNVLSLYFSDKKPAGMDMMPYAIKKVNGNRPVKVRLRSKLSLTSTIMEFRILVMNEITKNTIITSPIMWMYLLVLGLLVSII
tara:strand:+ start:2382 stop:2705 length:324 start_codon:yes stop_codon:yes gene_type:complete